MQPAVHSAEQRQNRRAEAAKLWVVIPAGGSGSRMNSPVPKQYLLLAGKAVLQHSLKPFLQHSLVAGIAVALAANDQQGRQLLAALPGDFIIAPGGDQRSESVNNALSALVSAGAADNDWVLVHDAARPCLPTADLNTLIEQLAESEVGGILALPVRDTLKRSHSGNIIDETIDRSTLWQALTPQMFRLGLLQQALQHCAKNGLAVTDEASAVEQLGKQPLLVRGSPVNLKITWPADIQLAEKLLDLTQ